MKGNGKAVEIELTRIFVKVVQNASFSKAAVVLRRPKSTVSKAISRLERETGTKLLLRTTRSLTLTAAGRAFYEACLGPISQIEDAQRSLHGHDSLLTGLLRITAPEDLGSFVIAPAIAELSERHPELRFELVYTDEVIDLVKDGFDFAVRLGQVVDSGLKIKKSGEVTLITVASPQYLAQAGKIRLPQDLGQHRCLTINMRKVADRWPLRSKNGSCQVSIRSKISSNQMTSLLQMALKGAGVALVPSYLCQSYLDNGELVRVLPAWKSPGIPVSFISPVAPSSSVRLKIAIDHLHAVVTEALAPQGIS